MSAKFSETHQLIWQHIDPSTKDTLMYDSVIQAAKYINVSQFNRVTCILFRITGTGTIQAAQLYAATTVAGAGATAISSSAHTSHEMTGMIGTACGTNATGLVGKRGCGFMILEATASDIEGTLANADFVSVKASFATAADEVGTLWILSEPRYGKAALTSTGSGT